MRYILILTFSFLTLFASTKVTIEVAKMHCPLCTSAVKKAIKKLDGIEKVSVKLNTKKAKIQYDEKKVTIEQILKAIKTTSYEGRVVE